MVTATAGRKEKKNLPVQVFPAQAFPKSRVLPMDAPRMSITSGYWCQSHRQSLCLCAAPAALAEPALTQDAQLDIMASS